MYAHDQHFLVVAAVKYPDLSALGQGERGAPEKIVIQLTCAGRFKRGDTTSLRIHTGEDVLDGAVFASGVQGLEDQQQ